ncbi:Hsp70 family protein [Nocardia sp. CDC159]|uniref:Hsp70 family protein n=1 Tax=Nocardia pulmonis TaxID=2951408 RepID=A0A9X2E967_9NOCA|nr:MULTISPECIES: Hsp70 family protein [Nocardia]MCM6776607.1 Hsp70 family protein [Nocardia pulmonis]MCM6789244.1 Hsp70 family protein [Nocardia sp. CDC159]
MVVVNGPLDGHRPRRSRRTSVVGVGISVGAVKTVSASVTGAGRTAVSSRKTAVTIDPSGAAAAEADGALGTVIADFADLAREPETVTVAGRVWSPTMLIASLVCNLLDSVRPAADVAITYPAVYSDKQVELLRQALELSVTRSVLLVPEPVAAVEWLAHECDTPDPGLVLVYDLGATSLDVALVRVGPGQPMIVGTPVRSYDFGGRPLGEWIAEKVAPSGDGRPPSALTDCDELRAAHVRYSFRVVDECLRSALTSISEVDRILVVGGASRGSEVAGVMAELGRPVVASADPGHSAAIGAAVRAARTADARVVETARTGRRPLVLAGAAALSVVAVSAGTLFMQPGPTKTSQPQAVLAPQNAPREPRAQNEDRRLKTAAQPNPPSAALPQPPAPPPPAAQPQQVDSTSAGDPVSPDTSSGASDAPSGPEVDVPSDPQPDAPTPRRERHRTEHRPHHGPAQLPFGRHRHDGAHGRLP